MKTVLMLHRTIRLFCMNMCERNARMTVGLFKQRMRIARVANDHIPKSFGFCFGRRMRIARVADDQVPESFGACASRELLMIKFRKVLAHARQTTRLRRRERKCRSSARRRP